MARRTSLICLLVEAGMRLSSAKHIDKELDRACILGMHTDDFAGLLLDWANRRTYDRLAAADAQIKKLQGYEDGPSLFTLVPER